MNYPDRAQCVVIEHCGYQSHIKSPKICMSTTAMKECEKAIKIACETTPLGLCAGTEIHDHVQNLDSPFSNIARVHYHASQIRNDSHVQYDLDVIDSINANIPSPLVMSSRVEIKGHNVFGTLGMKNVIAQKMQCK